MDSEKQIAEMANDLNDCITEFVTDTGDVYIDDEVTAQKMFNKGYCKQNEGEWETIPDYTPNTLIAYRHICSVCKTIYKDIRAYGHKYCHECGAKMKGGE